MNSAKCEITVLHPSASSSVHSFTIALPGIRLVEVEELELLGSPIGKVAINRTLNSMADRLKMLVDRLNPIASHCAFYLFKNCFFMPKLMYLLRTCPTFLHQQALADVDKIIREALEKLINVNLGDSQWIQALLPTRLGGLGIGSIQAFSTPAYIASINSTCGLVESILHRQVTNYTLIAAQNQWQVIAQAPLPIRSSSQKSWTTPIHRKIFSGLLLSLEDSDRRRLLGCSAPGSGDWVNCLPSAPLGLRLNDDQLRIAMCLRLGSPVSTQHICVCGVKADAHGSHALSCRRSSGRHARHSEVNSIIHRSLQAAGIPSRLEPVGLCRNDGKRPDGQTLMPWTRGRCLVWDATCVHRLAASYLTTSSTPGAVVATSAESRKLLKYAQLSENYIFQPVALETLGGIGKATWPFIQRIGSLLTGRSGDAREVAYLRQRLGVAVQRGNAACVLETFNF